MRIPKLALSLLPLLAAACDAGPVLAPGAADRFTGTASTPVREGNLAGADGVRLFYRVRGTGPDTAIVVTGGPGLSMAYMDRDLTPLEAGRTLIYYDARGAGYSELVRDSASLTLDLHADDVDAVRRHFGLERVSVVGHSWGAMVSSRFASKYSERIDRLVLVTPGPVQAKYAAAFDSIVASRVDTAGMGRLIGELVMGQTENPNATCNRIFDLLFSGAMHDPAALHTMRGSWCEGPPEAAIGLFNSLRFGRASLGLNWDLRPMLATVQAPTLVIHARSDAIVEESTAAYARAIRGAQLEVIDRAGHSPWLERPEVFFSMVNRFLRLP